jgi:hypothetical protein
MRQYGGQSSEPIYRLRPKDAQIGIVWQVDYIEEIVDDAKPDA